MEVIMAKKSNGISRPAHKVKMMYDAKVPMRDGVNLSTDIYLPDVDYPVPVILIRTPYDNNAEDVVHTCFYFGDFSKQEKRYRKIGWHFGRKRINFLGQ